MNPVFSGSFQKNDALFMYGAGRKKPFVFSYIQERQEVVYGPACKPEKEIKINACNKDGVTVIKRRGGGGTVLLSPGMVITLVVGNRNSKDRPIDIFLKINNAIAEILSDVGCTGVVSAGISDLAINGKKILGSSLYLQSSPFYYYYQSSLMVSSDVSLIEKYLNHPPKEPEYRKSRPHSDFCTTLEREGFYVTCKKISAMFSENIDRYI
jgi:lipoate---protein ligase